MLGLGGAFLAGLAALVASQVGDAEYVPFFIGLSFLGGVEAWSARAPKIGLHRTVARSAAVVWLVAAIWVGLLLLWEASYYTASRGQPGPPKTFLAVPVTVYYLLGLYGGTVLVAWSAFGRDIAGRSRSASARP